MVRMALDPIRSVLTRRSILLTLPFTASGRPPIRVELFLATQCPISNRYVSELNRLAAMYVLQGVSFEACFPEPNLSAAQLHKWTRDFGVQFLVQLDPQGRRATTARATLTPVGVVFSGTKLIYCGRIDDRYVSLGKSRSEPTRRDVAETLDLLLAGAQPAPRFTKSWGCYIEAIK